MNSFPSGTQDLLRSFLHWRIFTMLGWQRIKGNYKRTLLGDFWVTINKAVHILTIGLVFSFVFQSDRAEFIPHLAVGTIVWALIAGNINTACNIFVSNTGMIKQVPLPLHLHLVQLYWQNWILLAHNLVLMPGIWWYAGLQLNWMTLCFFPGLILLQINVAWIGLLCAIACTRYRDLTQIVGNLLQISYFLTPIMWMPERIAGRIQWQFSVPVGFLDEIRWHTISLDILDLNLFHHLIELIRAPLLQNPVLFHSWALAAVLAVLGWSVAIFIYNRTRSQIVYWL